MALVLRPYQDKLIQDARASLVSSDSTLIVLPPGGGKTVLTARMMDGAARRGRRAVFAVHRKELLDQTVETMRLTGIDPGVIAPGHPEEPNKLIQVASIQTLARPARLYMTPSPDLYVVDECFPAGTMISDVPIEQIKVGDFVLSFDDRRMGVVSRRVVRTFKRKTCEVIRICLENGDCVVCTPNHPIFTDRGWCHAEKIAQGSGVYVSSVRGMRNDDGVSVSQRLRDMASEQENLLFGCVHENKDPKGFFGNNEADKSLPIGNHFAEDERKKSDVDLWRPRENGEDTSTNRTQTVSPGRKRKWGDNNAKVAARGSWGRLGKRAHCDNGGRPNFWMSHAKSLQSRYSQPSKDDCYRGGRRIALLEEGSGAGCSENHFLAIQRVASVEVFKQGSSPEFEHLCPNGDVFNLEVSGTHTYFANGFAVHNCHHSVGSQYRTVREWWSTSKMVGLTATPERLDGQGLKDSFGAMVEGPDPDWLIKNKFLAPYRAFAPTTPDVTELPMRMGDYAVSAAEAAMNKPSITGDAIATWQKLTPGKQGICFCVSIKHSMEVAQAFQDAGVSAAHVDGDTDKNVRKAIIQAFRQGAITILCNVDLFGEGFDVPGAGVGIFLRPTASFGLWRQQVGRILRFEPGKVAFLHDHAGNFARHGLPDDPVTWSLEGREKRSRKDMESVLAVRTCEKCYAVSPARMKTCEQCGAPFPLTPREVLRIQGELAEIQRVRVAAQKKAEKRAAKTVDELVALAKSRGYKNPHGWAQLQLQMRDRYGRR